MCDYIERQAALDLIESAGAWGWSKNQMYEEMQHVKSANVREDVFAKWEYITPGSCLYVGRTVCSNCRNETKIKFKYCPYCGARMIG